MTSRIAKALEQLLLVINEDKDGGYFICAEAKPAIIEANLALEYPEGKISHKEWMNYLKSMYKAGLEYSKENPHSEYPFSEWVREVAEEGISLGYHAWVEHHLEVASRVASGDTRKVLVAECIYEPRGDHGLEGYQAGDRYMAEFMPAMGMNTEYYRVWPVAGGGYETCGPGTFRKYFKEVSE